MKEVHRILYIRTDRLGDTLMNLPAVRLLRQTYPKSWITWMVSKTVEPILRGNPDVDEFLIVEPEQISRDRRYQKKIFDQIRRARFDLAVCSNPTKWAHAMVFLARIPLRVGWRRKWSVLLNRTLPDLKERNIQHEVASNLNLVHLVSKLTWDGLWNLTVDTITKDKIEERLKKEIPGHQPIVLIHPGSSHSAKRWPIENFAFVCQELQHRQNKRIILIGGSEEEPVSRDVSKLVGGVVDWTGALSLPELSALCASNHVQALLSADSGPLHVAWIHGKPVVGLYARNLAGSDPKRWGPLDSHSISIHKNMDEVTASEVLEALDKVAP